jgi:hypothetical protein
MAREAKQNCPVSKDGNSSDCKAAHDRARLIPGGFTQPLFLMQLRNRLARPHAGPIRAAKFLGTVGVAS